MTHEKEHVRWDIEKIKFGELTVMSAVIMAVIAVLVALMLEQDKIEINPQKNVYLFLHGSTDLQEKAETVLVAYGFQKEQIITATSENVGGVGDYMAMLWMPPDPDHIIIQLITGVTEIEPDKIFGLWKGVSNKDIDTISLE